MSKKNVEWEWKKLGDVCEIVSGRNQKAVEVPNGKYPIYGSGGEMGRANSFICPAGCTIVGRKGSINNPIFVNEPFWNVDTAFGFSPKKNCNSFFLFYFCKSFDFYSMNKGTTIPSLVKADLLEISIPIPPLDEQERIVKVLDDAFEKIDTIKTTAETNLQNAKDLFDSALTKELNVKKNILCQMKEVCDVRDGTHDSPKYHKTGYPLVTSKNLKDGKVNFEKIKLISEEDYVAINKRSKVNIGDVLFAMIGTIGNPVLITEEPNYAIKNMALFKPKEQLDSSFLQLYLNSPKVLEKMNKEANGSTQRFVGLDYLRNFQIPLPPLSIQKQIVAKLDSLSEKVKQLESNYKQVLADCDELKKALLKQAFEGML